MTENAGRLVMSEDKNSIIGVAPHDGDSDVLIILNRVNTTNGGGTDGGGTGPSADVRYGTIRLVWGDSDTSTPSEAPPEGACADWYVYKGPFLGPPSLYGSSCGNSLWHGIDDVEVPVDAGTPYDVDVRWYDPDGETEFRGIYVTSPDQIIPLHY